MTEPMSEAELWAFLEERRRIQRRRSRMVKFTLAAIVIMLIAGAAGRAWWSAGGSGTASAGVGTLGAPTGVNAAAANSSDGGVHGTTPVTVSWVAPTGGTVAPTGYYVTRYDENTSDGGSTACETSAASTTSATTCDDAVGDGDFHYVVTAVYRSWTATSGASNSVHIANDITPPAVTLTAPADGSSTNNQTPLLTGSAGVAAGDLPTVTVDIYSGTSATGTPIQTVTADGSLGNWAVAAGSLNEGEYTAQARQSDQAGNTGTSASSTFRVDTAAPAVTLNAPADGTSTNNAQPTFSGAAGTAAGDSSNVTVKIYSGANTGGTPLRTLTATAASGAWSTSPSTNLGDGQYTAQASQVDAAGNTGTSAARTFSVDTVAPTVSVAKAAAQAGTTNSQPIAYTITLSEAAAADLTAAGVTVTAPAANTGLAKNLTRVDATHYTLAVSGLKTDGSGDGAISVSVAAHTVSDVAGNGNSASNSASVTWDTTKPTATVAKKAGQADPTNAQPINYTVTLSEPASADLTAAQVSVSAPAADTGITKSVTKTDGTHYNVAVSGLKTDGSGDGSISVSLAAGAFTDAAGNTNTASNTASVTWDTTKPTAIVTPTDAATNTQPITYSVVFSEPVSDLSASGVTLTKPAADTGATVSVSKADSTHFSISVAGLKTDGTGDGNVTVSVNGNAVTDLAGNGNQGSGTATTAWDTKRPAVTVTANATATNTQPISYIVVFSEAVTDLDPSGVTVNAPAADGTPTVAVSKTDSTHFTVSVSGLKTDGTGDGTISASVNGNAVSDAAGNGNTASGVASTTWDTQAPQPTSQQFFDTDGNGKIDQIKVTFNEAVAASTDKSVWTLANQPTAVSIASVTTAGSTATLTLNEGSAFDTAATGMTVALSASTTGIRDAVGNQASFSAKAVADKAGPVLVSATSANVGTISGLMQQNDTLTLTFSEPIANAPSSVSVQEMKNGNAQFSVSNLLQTSSLDKSYTATQNGSGGTATSSAVTLSNGNKTLTVTVGSITVAGGGVAAGGGSVTIKPVTTLTDSTGNAAVGTTSVTIASPLF